MSHDGVELISILLCADEEEAEQWMEMLLESPSGLVDVAQEGVLCQKERSFGYGINHPVRFEFLVQTLGFELGQDLRELIEHPYLEAGEIWSSLVLAEEVSVLKTQLAEFVSEPEAAVALILEHSYVPDVGEDELIRLLQEDQPEEDAESTPERIIQLIVMLRHAVDSALESDQGLMLLRSE